MDKFSLFCTQHGRGEREGDWEWGYFFATKDSPEPSIPDHMFFQRINEVAPNSPQASAHAMATDLFERHSEKRWMMIEVEQRRKDPPYFAALISWG